MWPIEIDLNFCLFNTENLFLLFDASLPDNFQSFNEGQWQKLNTSIHPNKELRKCNELAKVFSEIDADIFLLCEVGGLESLKNFNQYFLGNRYSEALIEGNSLRNIDVGLLIKKNLPFYFDIQTNKHRPINFHYPTTLIDQPDIITSATESLKFSRDALELRLFQKNSEQPFFMTLLSHLKSRLDPDRVDPNGFGRRRAEFKTLIDIYQEMEAQFPNVPKLVCGDFNGYAGKDRTDEEFKDLYLRTSLIDALELAQVEPCNRSTYYQVRSGQKTEGRQIDYCFLNSEASVFLNKSQTYVYRYKNHLGLELDPPQQYEEKLILPSDHYPLVFKLEKLHCW